MRAAQFHGIMASEKLSLIRVQENEYSLNSVRASGFQRVLNLLESSLLWLYLPTTENLLCSSPRLSGDPTGFADPPIQNHTRRRSRSTSHLPGPGQLLSSRTPTLEG
uniref:Uncharacterized protein n=1 Tax=Chlorocebus sabaeus TaxID=60711 RepID=A0A0D9RI11_CHLSB